MSSELDLTTSRECVILGLRVSAGSSREGLVGILGGRLKIAVRVAPERGKANKAVLRLLEASLELPRGSARMSSGAGSPLKTVRIHGVSEDLVRENVRRALGMETR